jgi:hypothetical protein
MKKKPMFFRGKEKKNRHRLLKFTAEFGWNHVAEVVEYNTLNGIIDKYWVTGFKNGAHKFGNFEEWIPIREAEWIMYTTV